MRCLQSFNVRCRQLREERRLSCADLAALCGTDEQSVAAWELKSPLERAYPSLDELVRLSMRTGTPLAWLLDLDGVDADSSQLDLPGLEGADDRGITAALDELENLMEDIEFTPEERELLRRFRQSTPEQQRLILQLMKD